MTEEKRSAFFKEEERRLNILGIPTTPSYYINRAGFANDTEFRAIPFFGNQASLYREHGDEGAAPFCDAVMDLEGTYGCRVYAAIYNSFEELGDMLTLLTISSDESEWEQEREDLKEMQPIAYVHNFTYPEFSEWGSVLLRMNGNVLERIG